VYFGTHGNGAFKNAAGSVPKFEIDALEESEVKILIRHKQSARWRAQQVAARAAPYLLRMEQIDKNACDAGMSELA